MLFNCDSRPNPKIGFVFTDANIKNMKLHIKADKGRNFRKLACHAFQTCYKVGRTENPHDSSGHDCEPLGGITLRLLETRLIILQSEEREPHLPLCLRLRHGANEQTLLSK